MADKTYEEMSDFERASSRDQDIVDRYYAEGRTKILRSMAKDRRTWQPPDTNREIDKLLKAIKTHASLRGWKADEDGDYDGIIEVRPWRGMTLDDLEAILHALDLRLGFTLYASKSE